MVEESEELDFLEDWLDELLWLVFDDVIDDIEVPLEVPVAVLLEIGQAQSDCPVETNKVRVLALKEVK